MEILRNETVTTSDLSLTIYNLSLNQSKIVEKNTFSLSPLTKISHLDYIGKDLCVHCHKIVAKIIKHYLVTNVKDGLTDHAAI